MYRNNTRNPVYATQHELYCVFLLSVDSMEERLITVSPRADRMTCCSAVVIDTH